MAIARGLPVLVILVASMRMTVDDFGKLALVVTGITTASLLADSGTDNAATWLLSRATTVTAQERLFGSLRGLRCILAITLTFCLTAPQIQLLTTDAVSWAAFAALFCLANCLTANNAASRVMLRIKGKGEPERLLAEKGISGALFLAGVILFPASAELYCLAYGIGALVGAASLTQKSGLRRWRLGGKTVGTLIRAAIPFTLTTVCSAVVWRAPIFVLGSMGEISQAGFLTLATYPVQLLSSIPVLAAPLLLVKGGRHQGDTFEQAKRGAASGLILMTLIAICSVALKSISVDFIVDDIVWTTLLILCISLLPLWINPLFTASLRVQSGLWTPTVANATGAALMLMVVVPTTLSAGAVGAATSIVVAETGVLVTLLAIAFATKKRRLSAAS